MLLRVSGRWLKHRDTERPSAETKWASAPGLATQLSAERFPALAKAGWPRHQEDVAKPPTWSGRGGSFHHRLIGELDEPPRLRLLRRLRAFFLVAHPPRLGQGGEWLAHKRRKLCQTNKNLRSCYAEAQKRGSQP